MAYVTSWERIGIEKGRAERLLDGQRLLLRRMVRARFGDVPEALERRIDAADQEALDSLVDLLSTAVSLDELTGEPSDTE